MPCVNSRHPGDARVKAGSVRDPATSLPAGPARASGGASPQINVDFGGPKKSSQTPPRTARNPPKLPDTPGSLLDTKNRWFCFSIIVAGPPKSMVLFQFYVRRTLQSIVLFQYYCRWTRHIDGFVSLFCSPDPLHRWFCFSIMFAGPPKSMVLFQYYRFFSPARAKTKKQYPAAASDRPQRLKTILFNKILNKKRYFFGPGRSQPPAPTGPGT